jgi:hypothetical protein
MGERGDGSTARLHGARRNLANAVSESVRLFGRHLSGFPLAARLDGWRLVLPPRGGEGDETGQMRTNLHSSWAHGTQGTAYGLMELFPSIRPAAQGCLGGPAEKKVESGVGCSWRRPNMTVAILRLDEVGSWAGPGGDD